MPGGEVAVMPAESSEPRAQLEVAAMQAGSLEPRAQAELMGQDAARDILAGAVGLGGSASSCTPGVEVAAIPAGSSEPRAQLEVAAISAGPPEPRAQAELVGRAATRWGSAVGGQVSASRSAGDSALS